MEMSQRDLSKKMVIFCQKEAILARIEMRRKKSNCGGRVDADEKQLGLPTGETMFASIRDLREVADVWVQFDPSSIKINQGDTEWDSTLLLKKDDHVLSGGGTFDSG